MVRLSKRRKGPQDNYELKLQEIALLSMRCIGFLARKGRGSQETTYMRMWLQGRSASGVPLPPCSLVQVMPTVRVPGVISEDGVTLRPSNANATV